ncbi:MAG: hypothetical protein HOQ45_23935 [Nocardioidaceae bacterium]|nr:hypothetical protein [Nocardioidaceae bacterium]
MNTRSLRAIAAATVLAATFTVTATPAMAASGDKIRRGDCTGSTNWRLKVGPESGRLETEGQIDSRHNGQTWNWRLWHNGSISYRGTKTTKAPSGSFEVRRLLVNLKGTDTITFRARNPRSGEVCRGTVHF